MYRFRVLVILVVLVVKTHPRDGLVDLIKGRYTGTEGEHYTMTLCNSPGYYIYATHINNIAKQHSKSKV